MKLFRTNAKPTYEKIFKIGTDTFTLTKDGHLYKGTGIVNPNDFKAIMSDPVQAEKFFSVIFESQQGQQLLENVGLKLKQG